MLHIEIPGRAPMDIANVVFDYNGTIAVDGAVLPELRGRLKALLKLVPVYVLTADTYGTVRTAGANRPHFSARGCSEV